MKALQKLVPAVLFLMVLLGSTQIVAAQKSDSTKEQAIKALVDNQQYVFYAESVSPMSGRQRFLTSEYTVAISKDTVVSELPYFGKAYSVSPGSTDGGIKFTSTKFEYKVSPRKKGGWDINIKPKDISDVQQLFFTVYKNGSAYLSINSTNRQAISYNGHISERKSR
jgi:hypothetical protein